MMNDELCLPSTPFELSWPKCRVNGGRRRWALTKVNPKITAPNSPQKAQKSGDQDAPPKVSVSLISLSTGIEEGV